MSVQEVFFYEGAIRLNLARIEHLKSLQFQFENKTVLETGCGGIGNITSFFLESGAKVTLNDYRIENIQSLLETIKKPDLPYNQWNLNEDIPITSKDDLFDIVVCYGTLYHLTKPDVAIRNLARICKEYMIISTCTNGKNTNDINPLYESNEPTQNHDGYGCRPGRLFVWSELSKHFKFVYMVKTQTSHEEFPLTFPSNHQSSRCVYIGSHIDLSKKTDLLVNSFQSDYSQDFQQHKNNNTFYYFEKKEYPIQVTDETLEITPVTFQRNGELWEQKSLHQFFSRIDVNSSFNIVDIGAQSGLYSLFAKYLPQSTFYAFEPFAPTFKLLNDNLKLNGITNVKTFPMAISDKRGGATLNTSRGDNGLHTLGETPLRFNDVEKINVETTTLNDFFENIKMDFIKIDTEGFEYYILEGGRNVIERDKPIIQMEFNKINMMQCHVKEEMIKKWMEDMKYKILTIVEEEWLIVPETINAYTE